jgi:hypothetical protein
VYDLHHEEGANCGPTCSLVPDRRGEYSVNVFSEEAVSRIHSAAEAKELFFLYLAYQSVHEPHQAPQQYIDMYPPKMANGILAAMLTALDDGIKNVTLALTQAGVADSTLIIFTADNGGTGGSSNYPLRGEKHSVFEGGVRGTAFAWGWGIGAAAGTKTSALLHGADWLPTLVGPSVAGGSTAGTLPLDGVDNWAAITTVGGRSARDEVIFGHERGPDNCGLRNGPWKLLRAGGDKPDKWDPPGYNLTNKTAVDGNGDVDPIPVAVAVPAAVQCGVNASTTNGTCYPGNDISGGSTTASAAACCTKCAANAECGAWLWHTDNTKCFLKSVLDTKGGKKGKCVASGNHPPPAPPSPTPPTPKPGPASVLLYNLATDPYEHNDVAAANPDVVARMMKRLLVLDQNLHRAVPNASCPARTPGHDPVVGNVWMPWC